MRITKRQLRRIIKEYGQPLSQPELRRPVRSSVTGILSGMFMSGRELAAKVRDELAEFNPTEDEVFTVLDEMLEDGAVVFDVEEDEWSLP